MSRTKLDELARRQRTHALGDIVFAGFMAVVLAFLLVSMSTATSAIGAGATSNSLGVAGNIESPSVAEQIDVYAASMCSQAVPEHTSAPC